MKHTCRSLGAGPLRRAGLPPLCTQRRARTYPVVCHACMRPWTAVVQNVGSQGCGLPHGPLNFHLLLRARLRVPCCCPPAMAIACWNNGAGCRTVCVLYFWHYLRCMTRYRNAMYSRLSLCTPPCTLVFFLHRVRTTHIRRLQTPALLFGEETCLVWHIYALAT